jgi:hypothetical protein
MFSNNGYQGLSELSTEERNAFDIYLKQIKRKDLKPRELTMLSFLYKISENDPEFKIFFAAHPKFDEVFAKRLEKLNYIPEPLSSPDKNVELSLCSQLMGAWVCFEMKNSSNPVDREKFLDKASEIGIHAALNESIYIDLAAIEKVIKEDFNPSAIKREIDKRAEKIFSKAEKLGGLYWSLGYLHAAIALLNVADSTYKNLDQLAIEQKVLTNQKLDDNILTIKLLRQAIKYATYSQQLENTDQSHKILKVLSPEGLFRACADIFKDWPEAQVYIATYCSNLAIPNPADFSKQAVQTGMQEVAKLNLRPTPAHEATIASTQLK